MLLTDSEYNSTLARLKGAMMHASANKYVLGVKLVRGAYHLQENEHHLSKPTNHGTLPPVWSEKHETDACYNQCAMTLLDNMTKQPPSSSAEEHVNQTGILFATHNRESCDYIMEELVRRGLASVEETPVDGDTLPSLKLNQWVSNQLQFAQLYG